MFDRLGFIYSDRYLKMAFSEHVPLLEESVNILTVL
jgi:hypothetical protein